jgi:hypothetical protein
MIATVKTITTLLTSIVHLIVTNLFNLIAAGPPLAVSSKGGLSQQSCKVSLLGCGTLWGSEPILQSELQKAVVPGTLSIGEISRWSARPVHPVLL